MQFLAKLQDLGFWRSKFYFDWDISLTYEEKNETNFVGIKNLGCICYMNSLLQQFYMIPSLRDSIIECPDSIAKDNLGDDESITNTTIYQLKYLFASLKYFDKQYIIPKEFTTNFKNYLGEPMNVAEQMDVDEFFNLLLDKLENNMKGTKYNNLLNDYFSGLISDELICKGCPHNREIEQNFNSINLQVKNKKSIIESMNSFIETEMLYGSNAYFCSICNKKVDTLKRQSIKKLPKVLILVLKRFEYNFDIMHKIKLNDYCEFTEELNMEPFTQRYIRNKEIQENNLNNSNKVNNANKTIVLENTENKEEESEKNIKVNSKEDINKDKAPMGTEDLTESKVDSKEDKSKNIEVEDPDINTNSNDNNSSNGSNECTKYSLTGVIIHTGTADSGHYYSIIKDIQKNEQNLWYEFNDTIVKAYDFQDIKNEAFGGQEQ